MQEIKYDSRDFGGHSMVANLQRVLMRKPTTSLSDADPTTWHYTDRVNLKMACEEHDHMSSILRNHKIEVIYHQLDSAQHADAIFVHDPALITDKGAVILRMGKALRRGEEALIKQSFIHLNIPTLGELTAPALAECGDLIWLDQHTLLAGKGFRTNDEGIKQLKIILAPLNVTVIDFDLSYYQGQDACLHLQSFINLVDVDMALAYLPLIPTRLYQLLRERNFKIIEVPENEFTTMGANVLALKPKVVLILENNSITKKRLENAGVTVLTYKGTDISLKTEGGPTCLTRALKRVV